MTSTCGPEKVAKYKSLLNHIQNVHTRDIPVFPKCAHLDKVFRDHQTWFQPGIHQNITLLYYVKKLIFRTLGMFFNFFS